MAALPHGSDVPWHRVVNARGGISARSAGPAFEQIQRLMLEAEGIRFGPGGRIDLELYGWDSAG
jgi:methylated-DNA-protein-cysteine methyltransferase-like protein